MLTDAKIRNAKPQERPYRLPDGKGLYLEVRPTGARLWRYRYRLPHAEGGLRENLFALGTYGKGGKVQGEFTLDEARQERARARELVKMGIHPSHDRERQKQEVLEAAEDTFKAMAEEWIEANKGLWTPYYRKQVERAFELAAYPSIGSLPITAVKAAHLLKIVKGKAETAPTVALLLRQWMGAVFRHAIAHLKADHDPSSAIRGVVKRRTVKNKEPLRPKDIPTFRTALAAVGGNDTTKLALEILLLTFARPGELRRAAWEEFDLDGALWELPPGRMKMRRAHLVPLSSQAVERLRALKRLTGDRGWLLPNSRDPQRPITATTLNRMLERMGYLGRLSAHGFRATASTWLNETGFRPDAIELQLAHKPKGIRADYNKAMYLPERRAMVQQWADFLDVVSSGKVTPIGTGEKAAA